MSCGADTLAKTLLDNITSQYNFTLPDIDLSSSDLDIPTGPGSLLGQVLKPDTIDQITMVSVDGSGAFDVMMRALREHLQVEFKSGRITGAEYTKAYIANTQLAMQTAVAWTAQKDQSYWQGVQAQVAAMQGAVSLKIAAFDLATAKVRALSTRADFGLTAMKMANEDQQYCNNTLQGDILRFNLQQMLPVQLSLTKEQMETARAQTADARTDGSPVSGAIQAQKDLQRQQIISYQRSSQLNAAKVFTDGWMTIKAIDEGIDTPGSLTSVNVSNILASLKTSNGL